MIRLFKKKFRLRIKHFKCDKYVVQWACYYVFSTYYILERWLDFGYDDDLECWNPKFFKVKEAETFVKKIKSKKDIDKWYEIENKKRKDFYREKKKIVPYEIKQIL